MCGIVGAIRMKDKVEDRDRNLWLQLISTGVVRGHHGTGVMVLNPDGTSRAVKVSGPPYHLMVNKKFNDLWDDITKNSPKAIIGHNRHATTGGKTSEDAHPFVFKHISMVHNGTLISHGTDLPKFKDFKVDSEALAHGISELGIESALSKTNGAYAIVYFNGKEKTLNMVRNAERPLFVCFDKFQYRILIASEKEQLEWVAKRNAIIGTGVEFKELPINTLWTFNFDDNCITPIEKKVLGKVWGSYPQSDNTGAVTEATRDEWFRDRVWDPVQSKYVMKSEVTTKTILPGLSGDDAVNEFLSTLKPAVNRENVIKALATINNARNSTCAALVQPPKPAVQVETIRQKEFNKNPRLKEVYVNTKNYTAHTDLTFTIKDSIKQTTTDYVLKAGDSIMVQPCDHISENEAKQLHAIVAYTDEFPNARIHFRVEGDGVVDAMFEAVAVNVEVCSFLMPLPGSSDGETIVWCKNPRVETPVVH